MRHPAHSLKFDSEERRRAWSLAVERSFQTINQAVLDPIGLQRISKLAEEGDLIAIGIMFQYTKARMQQ